jgi:hypothetical protein
VGSVADECDPAMRRPVLLCRHGVERPVGELAVNLIEHGQEVGVPAGESLPQNHALGVGVDEVISLPVSGVFGHSQCKVEPDRSIAVTLTHDCLVVAHGKHGAIADVVRDKRAGVGRADVGLDEGDATVGRLLLGQQRAGAGTDAVAGDDEVGVDRIGVMNLDAVVTFWCQRHGTDPVAPCDCVRRNRVAE